MKIEDLRDMPKLYKLALKRSREYVSEENIKNKSIQECFTWSSTEEGHYFWSSIENRDFSSAKKIYSERFGKKKTKKLFKVQHKLTIKEKLELENEFLREKLQLTEKQLVESEKLIDNMSNSLKNKEDIKRYDVKQEVRIIDGVVKHYNREYLSKEGKYILAKDIL